MNISCGEFREAMTTHHCSGMLSTSTTIYIENSPFVFLKPAPRRSPFPCHIVDFSSPHEFAARKADESVPDPLDAVGPDVRS